MYFTIKGVTFLDILQLHKTTDYCIISANFICTGKPSKLSDSILIFVLLDWFGKNPKYLQAMPADITLKLTIVMMLIIRSPEHIHLITCPIALMNIFPFLLNFTHSTSLFLYVRIFFSKICEIILTFIHVSPTYFTQHNICKVHPF